MAELVFAFLARQRKVTKEAWDFQGVTGHAYAFKYPFRLSDRGIVSHWKTDQAVHTVTTKLFFEGEEFGEVTWQLESSPKPDHYVSHFQQLPATAAFEKSGRVEIVFFLDGKRVHQFPFEVFAIETMRKRQNRSS